MENKDTGDNIPFSLGLSEEEFAKDQRDLQQAAYNCDTDLDVIKIVDAITSTKIEAIAQTWCLGKFAIDIARKNCTEALEDFSSAIITNQNVLD